MNCDRLREILIEHVEGVLGAEDAEGAREHLAHCLSCSDLREEVRRGFAALDTWEDEHELPAGSFDRLLARLPHETAPFPAGAERDLVGAGAVLADSPVLTPAAAIAAGAPPARRAGRVLPFAAGLATAAAALWVFQGAFDAAAGPDGADTGPVRSGITVVDDGGAPSPFRTDDATAREEREVLRGSERPLRFDGSNLTLNDYRNGLVRRLRLPTGVDPASVMVVEDDPLLEPAGAVR